MSINIGVILLSADLYESYQNKIPKNADTKKFSNTKRSGMTIVEKLFVNDVSVQIPRKSHDF